MHHTPEEWSRRRTRSLLSLFQTQAPLDFRVSILRRAQELQHTMVAQQAHVIPPRGSWERYRTWLIETFHTTPRLLGMTTALSSVCVLIIGLGLRWHAAPPGRALAPGATPMGELAHLETPPPTLPGLRENTSVAREGDLHGATHPPALILPTEPQTLPPSARVDETPSSTVAPERIVVPPLVPPRPWITGETSPAMQPSPRVGYKRTLSGKSKRAKKAPGAGKDAPA